MKEDTQAASQASQDSTRGLKKDSSQNSSHDWRKVLLHGTLHVSVHEAADLPNLDRAAALCQKCLEGFCFPPKVAQGSDPYAVVSLDDALIAHTRAVKDNMHPVWDTTFIIPVAHHCQRVTFTVKDEDAIGADLIGHCRFASSSLLQAGPITGWFNLDQPSAASKKLPKIRISMHFTPAYGTPTNPEASNPPTALSGHPPADSDALVDSGTTADLGTAGDLGKPVDLGTPVDSGTAVGSGAPVDSCKPVGSGTEAGEWGSVVEPSYCPLREDCKVTLFQDTTVSPDFVPEIELDGGRMYQPLSCWRDIYKTICEAKSIIYIGDWAFDERITLLRGEDGIAPYGNMKLGDLLIKKAEEGVSVLMLVWDDRSSIQNPFYSPEGTMRTHDEGVRRFFQNSPVHCVLMPRRTDERLPWFSGKVTGTFFSHHQKFLVADAPMASSPGRRTLVGYLGGIDLCGGRYDAQHHSLFTTLHSDHAHDFLQHCFKASPGSGPRQPWHDLHCKVEGPAVLDILSNFQERWRKATSRGRKQLKLKGLLKKLRVEDFSLQHCEDIESDCQWSAKILRSIDSGSVDSFPQLPRFIAEKGLVQTHGPVMERSIQDAYIAAIRRAQEFIYIENQYFIGSSYAWTGNADAGANNIVPMELALKIAQKIKEGKRFSVYVLNPFWPEGHPKSGTVQAVLFWQTRTKEMMYTLVANALEDMGLSHTHHPQDYLCFFALVNKEPGPNKDKELPQNSSDQEKVLHSGRMQIYVHSKLMVVDDEYVILGSANINQRSMDGCRDSEIAIGAFQPQHLRSAAAGSEQPPPRGEVHGFRMSLWAEHLGVTDPLYKNPKTIDCMRAVTARASHIRSQYLSGSQDRLDGHLIPYPMTVDKSGRVNALPECPEFPDLGGSVLGAPSPTLPPVLTS